MITALEGWEGNGFFLFLTERTLGNVLRTELSMCLIRIRRTKVAGWRIIFYGKRKTYEAHSMSAGSDLNAVLSWHN
jgi:hypothetical protein